MFIFLSIPFDVYPLRTTILFPALLPSAHLLSLILFAFNLRLGHQENTFQKVGITTEAAKDKNLNFKNVLRLRNEWMILPKKSKLQKPKTCFVLPFMGLLM